MCYKSTIFREKRSLKRCVGITEHVAFIKKNINKMPQHFYVQRHSVCPYSECLFLARGFLCGGCPLGCGSFLGSRCLLFLRCAYRFGGGCCGCCGCKLWQRLIVFHHARQFLLNIRNSACIARVSACNFRYARSG